jgi:Holliday junction resolvase
MKFYAKGVRAERELLHFLTYRGFACLRTASSGGHLSPVDVVALKRGRVLCFEIKSWSTQPRLDKKKLQRFKEWCSRADGFGFLAWYNKNQWRFLRIEHAENNQYDEENWLDPDSLLKAVDFQ